SDVDILRELAKTRGFYLQVITVRGKVPQPKDASRIRGGHLRISSDDVVNHDFGICHHGSRWVRHRALNRPRVSQGLRRNGDGETKGKEERKKGQEASH